MRNSMAPRKSGRTTRQIKRWAPRVEKAKSLLQVLAEAAPGPNGKVIFVDFVKGDATSIVLRMPMRSWGRIRAAMNAWPTGMDLSAACAKTGVACWRLLWSEDYGALSLREEYPETEGGDIADIG